MAEKAMRPIEAASDQTRLAHGIAASKRSEIDAFIVMDVMQAAAAKEATGAKVIHMEVGQPGTPAPKAAREAVKHALDSDPLGYTVALGNPALRARISRHYRETYGLDVGADRIVITNGSSAAFVLGFLALFDAGARVGLASPGYPCYRHILTALGCQPVMLETGPETRWMPTPDQIEASAKAGGLNGLLIASPANPTGTMLEPERLKAIVGICEMARIPFVSDEIYHGLTYGMPGWRVGWMVMPQRLGRAVERLAQNLYISPPAVAQVAALAAFDAREELEGNFRVYAANRKLLLEQLPKIGIDQIVPADGAFYLYCDISRFTDDSLAFAKAMLEETGVAATPGVDFDAARGRHFIRFSYSGTTADMAEGAERLKQWSRLKT